MPSESEHKNTYFVLRHDESLAMKQGLVVSLAENGVGKFGITEEGRRHTRQTILQALDEETVPKGVVIVSTDFDRGLQTAQEAAQILQPKAFHVSPLLRERGFQAYELSSDANYQIVWENDENEK
ncbi:MAG TPA: hypothetical protein VFQ63_02235, partial [Patescibacteria group bacterium]|nr:hypothetical protein [Patescibacteria group bacterium]